MFSVFAKKMALTHTLGHTSAQSEWENSFWYIPSAFLYCFLSPPILSPHIPRFTPSFNDGWVGGSGGGGWRGGLSVFAMLSVLLVRGGHSVTGDGGCGDEGVISSLGDR